MTTLRAKIALLLVLAIVGVAAFATAVIVTVSPQPDTAVLVEELRLIRNLAEALSEPRTGQPNVAALEIMPGPLEGAQLEEVAESINAVLEERGEVFRVQVTRPAQATHPIASIPVADKGWIAVPIPSAPVLSDVLPVLIGWMALIAVGATVIALYTAGKIIRPLAMLNAAVGSVGPDGILPELPENGPAEVRATAQALNRLSSHLQSATESRMRLIAGAGHDLRTPLTRMRLRAEFLPEEEREAWVRDLGEMERIADSAIRLVREEVDPQVRDVLRLDSIAGEVVGELRELGLPVELAESRAASVAAAPLALKRALRNLLMNAATHGGGAAIRIGSDERGATAIIDDSGPGIPEDLLARVFEPFFRVDPARRQSVPGAGLGLAISREIIQRYGGSIQVENRPEGGLRQILRLPLAA